MSLRLQINLLLAGVIVVFTVVVLAFQLIDTRRSVREETEAANRVATHLLGFFVNTYAKTSTPIVLESLERLGRVRSTEITLRDDDGHEVYHSPPSTYKQGRNAPAWYSALVSPLPMKSELRFYDSTLTIESNASRAVLDGWDDTVTLLEFGALVFVLGNVLVFWLVRRSTQPFRDDRARARRRRTRRIPHAAAAACRAPRPGRSRSRSTAWRRRSRTISTRAPKRRMRACGSSRAASSPKSCRRASRTSARTSRASCTTKPGRA